MLPRIATREEAEDLSIGMTPSVVGLEHFLPPAMRIVARFAFVEARITPLFAAIVGAHPAAMVALLEATPTGISNRIKVLKSCVEEIGDPRSRELVCDVLSEVLVAAGHRHKLAHWLWSDTSKSPGHLFLVRPSAYTSVVGDRLAQKLAAFHRLTAQGASAVDVMTAVNREPTGPVRGLPLGSVVAYSTDDLRVVAGYMNGVAGMVTLLQVFHTPEYARNHDQLKLDLERSLQMTRALGNPSSSP